LHLWKLPKHKEALVAELKQLKELLDGGMISQAEYDAKKAKLMEKWNDLL
jgi:hypothetical protein